jgi:AcrR family transcriptional regulator
VAITMAVKEASAVRASARERLLAAANELFYNEGVHTVGIDRVIEQAGVAKASLYNTFGSKDELVRAYLETRRASVTQRITQAVERYDAPRERLLAVFEGQGELFAQPDYRGCAFARASAESHPGDLAEQAAEAYRHWVRALLTDLAAQAGVPEPEVLARQLHLLYDGSGQSARMDHDPAAATVARAAAATLLDAALAGRTEARREDAHQRLHGVPRHAATSVGGTLQLSRQVRPSAGGQAACSLGCGSASPFSPVVFGRAGAWRSSVAVGALAWRGCWDSSSASSSGFSAACLP